MAAPELPTRTYQLVVAAGRAWGIGRGGGLPWKLAGDMAHFKAVTSAVDASSSAPSSSAATQPPPPRQNAVVMGRATWESLPAKARPLPGRLNVVLSRSAAGRTDENNGRGSNGGSAGAPSPALCLPDGVLLAGSLEGALAALASPPHAETVERVFVIGGAQVFKEALASPLCTAVHLTRVDVDDADCDTFMSPLDPAAWRLWSATPPRSDPERAPGAGGGPGPRYSFECHVRAGLAGPPADGFPPGMAAPHDEEQYLDLVREIIADGAVRGDRTGTGTVSLFGKSMRFNLRGGVFPLLTTKRVFWRGVAEELLWFVAGSTDGSALAAKGIGIWDGNGSRAFLDSVGLGHREEGDLGPVYGFQWRHWGAPYKTKRECYTGEGIDQLAECIRLIKTDPTSRRIVMSAWNPSDLPAMALPPCHMFAQFYVAHGELSCQLYQRSGDVGLGVPFNIASYALLTRLVAQVCGLGAGDLVHVLGDAHVYANHVDPLREQLLNAPRPFPTLRINPAKTDIDAFTFDDFELAGYEPAKKIAMQMAV